VRRAWTCTPEKPQPFGARNAETVTVRLPVLLLLALPAFAQIASVSTNAAGDRVYFTTYLRPIDTDHGPWQKAYLWTQDGVTLVADDASDEFGGWRVDGAEARADGVIAIRRSAPCSIGTTCINYLQEFSELRTDSGARHLPGSLYLAHKGPYALLVRASGFGFFPSDELRDLRMRRLRIDEPDAEPESVGQSTPALAGRWIADDGTVLTTGWVLKGIDGQTTPLGPAVFAQTAFLAPDASFVAYQLRDDDGEGELRLAYAGGVDISLDVSGRLLDLSADGSMLLYTQPVAGTPQAFLLTLPGGAVRQATDEPQGVDKAAVNADGSILFAVSGGRLLRVAADGRAETLLGPLPQIDQGPPADIESVPDRGVLVPGSTYRQAGVRLAAATTAAPEPAETTLDGIEVLVDDTAAPILWTSPFEIGFQVPWETPPFRTVFLTVRHRASGWEARVRGFLAERLAQPATELVGEVHLAVHQNFDRLVTPQDPARRGEVIHIYATGLGAVEPAVPTGSAAPVDRLTTLAEPCDWRMSGRAPADPPADVVFAGLAPGFTGFYQIDWRIPDDAAGRTLLYCGGSGYVGAYAVED